MTCLPRLKTFVVKVALEQVCATATPVTVGFPRVTFQFGQRQVAECRRDFVGGCTGIGQQATEGLAQAVRLAVEWEPGRRRCSSHPS